MNKTVQLVNEWGAFEAAHPQAEIEVLSVLPHRAKVQTGSWRKFCW